MRSFATGRHPQRRPGGPRRRGQDDAGRGPAAPRPGRSPASGGSRTAPPSATTSPRSSGGASRSSLGPGPVRVEGPQDQPDRHARLRRLPRRRRAALRVVDLAVFVVSAVDGRRGRRPRRLWREAAAAGRAPHDLRQQARPGAGVVRRARSTSSATPSAPASPRSSCRSATRRAFHGVADLLTDTAHLYDGRRAARPGRSPTRWTTSSTRSTTTSSRASSSADDELLERYLDGDIPVVEELEHTLARGVDDGHRLPGRVRLGDRADRHRPAGRLHLRDRPVARSTVRPSRSRAGDADRRGRPRPRRASRWRRVQDHRRPVRRPGVAVQGAVGHGPQRRPPREPAARAPTSASTACSPLRGKEHVDGDRGAGGRHRRGGQAERHRHRRHAGAQGHSRSRSTRSTGHRPVHWLAVVANDAGRRRQAGHRAAPPARTRTRRSWSTATTRPTRPCCGGTGETHLAVTLERLEPGSSASTVDHRGRAGPATARRSPAPAAAEGKHKKQSGGHGQFAVATHRWSSRSSAGEGFEFVDKIVGGAIPPPATSPRWRRASRRRWPTAACYGHPGGRRPGRAASTARSTRSTRSEMAFQGAGAPRASARRWPRPGPSCSSRSARLDVTVPDRRPGRRAWATSNSRRGRVQGTEHRRRRRAGDRRRRARRASSSATPSTCAR